VKPAAIQFFGNNANPYPGQLYLDSGAHNSAALIFRTAPTGGTITERMRVTSDGKVGIGTTNPDTARLRVETGAGGPRDAVHGTTFNNNGFGVVGSGIGNGSTGVLGQGSNRGVYGYSANGFGVLSESSTNVGVYGSSISGTGVLGESSSGNAGSFFGNVQINGRLTKSSGSFKIDHPLDPENRYLSHSSVESPDMMNIYNGNVTTDARGLAVVTLPDYFTALNAEYRYQLTVVGQFAQAIVARKIKNNRFQIKTNRPRVEVSWMVTGVRQRRLRQGPPDQGGRREDGRGARHISAPGGLRTAQREKRHARAAAGIGTATKRRKFYRARSTLSEHES